MVSVVIPLFNTERWIAETLDSILSQTKSRRSNLIRTLKLLLLEMQEFQ